MRASHPHEASPEIDARRPRLIERLAEAGDQRGLAKAHLLASDRYNTACLSRPWAEHARPAAGYADRAGDELLKAHALGEYILALVLGPADAPTIAREVEMVQPEQPGPYLQARIDVGRGAVCRFQGDFDEALRLAERAIEQFHSLGMRKTEARSALHLAMIHLAASDPMAAVPALQQADAFLAEQGERGIRSTIQAMLAWSYAFGGDLDAARAACDLANDLTAPDDIVNFMTTPLARARIALAEGDGQQAEEQARTAVDHALRTDQVFEQAAAKLELAHVLAALGRAAEARPEAREALAIYESKGDRPGMAKAQAMLDEL